MTNFKIYNIMTKKKTKVQEPVCPDYIHSMTKELADLLHHRQEDRFHKFEAFRYLMEKQAVKRSENPSEKQCPFTVTITQLALDWKWHRHTVTSFLEDLTRLGVIAFQKTREGFEISFTNLLIPSLSEI